MTKEITKSVLLQEIQDKFKLREYLPAKFLFDETVVPTYDIGTHLKNAFIQEETKSVTSMSGFLFYTIPQNERWTFNNYNLTFMTGSYTVTGVYITRISSGSGNVVYLDQVQGRSGSYAISMSVPVVMEPGDRIYVYVDSYISTGDLRLSIDTMLEEIR